MQEPKKEISPKKRGSASRLSEIRDSKTNDATVETDTAKVPEKKEEVKLPEIVYQSALLNNSNIHLQTSNDGTSLTCTVDYETYQKLKNMDSRQQQAVLQEIS